ncbi:MAG: hypothetical protein HMLKMBBP_00107 [Planctomycetes bacterium]|nr:hypothetical protein [Planctomycetota bacterium]
MHKEAPMNEPRASGYVPTEVPEGWRAPAHPYPDMRCARCGAQLVPWGTVLRGTRELVQMHCGDHPVADRLWDERTDEDCGPLHETRR